MSRGQFVVPLLAGLLLAGPGCGGAQQPAEDDAALQPAQRTKLEQDLQQLEQQKAQLKQQLKTAEAKHGSLEAAAASAERTAGVATGQGATLSTGGLTSQPPSGVHLRVQLDHAVWELTPTFQAGRSSGDRSYFPFGDGYRSTRR